MQLSLSNGLPDSSAEDMAANQAQLENLESRISELTASVNTRRRTIAILADAMQDLIHKEADSTASPALSPESSEAE